MLTFSNIAQIETLFTTMEPANLAGESFTPSLHPEELLLDDVPPEPEEEAALREWAFRPWLVLTATIAVYAVLMDAGFGFVPSLMVLVIGCAAAHKDVRWIETLVLSVCVTAASVAIFYFGLRLPYQLFWWSA